MTENKGSNRRHSPGMESDQAFGKWCKEQEFGVGRQALLHYRLSWQEFTANHDLQEKITDYNAWSRIASLNHIQKPRVLERLALFRNTIKPPQNRLQATQ